MNYWIREILLAWLGLLLGLAVFARGEALEQAWAEALSVDNRLAASHFRTEAARWQHDAAQRGRLPQVSNKTGYIFLSESPNWRLNQPAVGLPPLTQPIGEDNFLATTTMASVPLYTGGKISASISATASDVCAEENDGLEIVLAIKLEVAAAYTTVLRAARAVDVAEATVLSLQEHARIIKMKLDEGLVAKNDLLAAEVALANARQDAIRARNAVEIASAGYNRLLGRPQTQPLDLEELEVDPIEVDLEPLAQLAINSRPHLARLAAQANSLRCQAERTLADTRPQVSVMGGYTFLENKNMTPQDYWSLTFGLDWTPYDGGVTRSKSNALQQQASALDRMYADASTRIELDVRRSWLDAQETRRRVDVSSQAISQAEENLRVAKQRYQSGQGTNTEVLDAETLRTRSYSNYYNAIYDAVVAVFRLQRAVGTL